MKSPGQPTQRSIVPIQPIVAIACVVAVVVGGVLSARALERDEGREAKVDAVEGGVSVADDLPLRGGSPSLRAIAEAVVAGLSVADREALAAVLVDREDFQGRLFAGLSNHPAAAQMGPALLWDMQAREGADELDRAVRTYGGRPWELVAVEVDEVERRQGIVIHRRPRLRVVDRSSGEEVTLRILGSVIEHSPSGTFALLTYKHRGAS